MKTKPAHKVGPLLNWIQVIIVALLIWSSAVNRFDLLGALGLSFGVFLPVAIVAALFVAFYVIKNFSSSKQYLAAFRPFLHFGTLCFFILVVIIKFTGPSDLYRVFSWEKPFLYMTILFFFCIAGQNKCLPQGVFIGFGLLFLTLISLVLHSGEILWFSERLMLPTAGPNYVAIVMLSCLFFFSFYDRLVAKIPQILQTIVLTSLFVIFVFCQSRGMLIVLLLSAPIFLFSGVLVRKLLIPVSLACLAIFVAGMQSVFNFFWHRILTTFIDGMGGRTDAINRVMELVYEKPFYDSKIAKILAIEPQVTDPSMSNHSLLLSAIEKSRNLEQIAHSEPLIFSFDPLIFSYAVVFVFYTTIAVLFHRSFIKKNNLTMTCLILFFGVSLSYNIYAYHFLFILLALVLSSEYSKESWRRLKQK